MFTCKGCTEVARLVGEVEDLRKMMESLKRMVTGQGLEEKRGETGDQEATLEEEEEKEKEKCVGEKTRDNSSTDNMQGSNFVKKIYLSDGQVDLQNHLSVMKSTCPTQENHKIKRLFNVAP